ncbi:MAG TPA: SDR family oxidoreductase [Phycisphaerales bacterium]|nr:SDR family oxidoreductase [Phycisphaerales bacterium]
MNIDLRGKHALVCGSTQGIGRACAESLAELGASVTLMARNAEALATVQSSLGRPANQSHDSVVADFSDPESVRRAVTAKIASGAAYHILINNTGGPPGGRAIDANPDEFLAAFRAHLVCNQILAQALVPGMKAGNYGRIINIISTSVKAPIPGLGVSNTIRGAVASWAKTLANELGPLGITVNNVLPGYTDTDRLKSLIDKRADAGKTTSAAVAEDFRKTIPMGRFGTATEIANAVAFLASPAASYISGINLPVDGGRTPTL